MYYKRILYVDATDIERYNNGKNTYLSCSLYIQKILNVFQADISQVKIGRGKTVVSLWIYYKINPKVNEKQVLA